MNKVLVISPSGNWYGSEQVLFDYLKHTGIALDVQVPAGSMFYDKLSNESLPHSIKTFSGSLPIFYAKIFLDLLTDRYQCIYINEAGHVRYITWLALFFQKKKFITHVRVLEDTLARRWKQGVKKNIEVVAISKFIQNKLPVNSQLLYDGYSFSKNTIQDIEIILPVLRVALIGRITKSKGTHLLPSVLECLRSMDPLGRYHFHLYGGIAADMSGDATIETLKNSPEIIFEGFEENRDLIYEAVDAVLHLSSIEPLGRIFFEAIDYAKPLIGIRAGGIGEIGEILHLKDLLVDDDPQTISGGIAAKLILVRNNYAHYVKQSINSLEEANRVFDPISYARCMDNLLTT